MPSWEQREIIVNTRDAGCQEIRAYTYGQLAIVPMRAKGEWLVDGKFGVFCVTHIASGKWIVNELYDLKRIANLVEELSDLNFDRWYDDWQRDIKDTDFSVRAKAIIEEWKRVNSGYWRSD